MRDLLPYLKCFESASRHLNFTNAAEELNVSQSAVSQQMRSLTRCLNFPLFRKQNNKLCLTYEGEALAKVVEKAFSDIEGEVVRLYDFEGIGDLKIGIEQSLGIGWLLPKLDNFEARLMDSNVTVSDNTHRLRLGIEDDDDGVDISIQILNTAPDIVSSIELPNDSFIAICSPETLYVGASEMSPRDFKNASLLTLSQAPIATTHVMDAATWAKRADVDAIPMNGKEVYSTFEMLVQATIHCRGVAIVRKSLADDHLRAGRVIKALPQEVPCFDSYYVTWMEKSENIINIREFVSWVEGEFSVTSHGTLS